jgi:hypothetical protein
MEDEMGLKRKQIVMRQKDAFEQELKDRLALLAQKGIKGRQVDRDPIVKRLKADVKATNKRLAKIADIYKRTEEMIRIKAEKAAAPKKEPAGKAEKPKSGPAEGKAKKPKAPPAEGAKAPKPAESPAEPKAPKKKAEKAVEEPPAK